MKELIDTIESIGFKELGINSFDNIFINLHSKLERIQVFEFKNWIIMIHDGHWELTYHYGQNPSMYYPVNVVHKHIPFDDRKILLKYFSSELREEKLKELGIL